MDSNLNSLSDNSNLQLGIFALTDNNVGDYSPQISDKNIVWSSSDGNDNEIYLYDYDNATVTQLTNNDVYDSSPQISGTNVVWSSYDGNDNEIFFYNGTETIQLTDNDVNDGNPRISGNNVAWLSYEGSYNYKYPPNSEIYLYNGTETVKLTDNDTYKGGFSISGNKVVWSDYDGKDSEIYLYDGNEVTKLTLNAVGDYNPQISGDKIVWTAYDGNDDEIYLYNGNTTIQLTDNDTYESSPQISGDNVVWTAYDGNDNEIYLYDGNTTIQLTDNDDYEYNLQISGDNLVWSAYDGNDDEIYLYDGNNTIQLTDNNVSDYNVQISGNNIVWSSYDGNDDEIYLNFDPPLTLGEINGYKWNDLNENGQFDADESGIAGWTIYLDSNENGQLDGGETSTVTDANGFYSFRDLKFGNYTVAEVNEPRWNQTYPFAYEYEWQDSKQPDGITFDWVDISNVGTEVNLSDDDAADVTLPFSFSFDGKDYDALKISSNGYLTFDTNGSDPYNTSLANSYNFNNIIAIFWDDLNPAFNGSIYHYYDETADRFIVQYQDVARYEVEDSLTFQTILNSDGSIIYQYKDMDAAVNSATVGLENSDGTAGLQIVYDNQNDENPYIENGLAIGFTPVRSSDTVNNHQVFLGSGETRANLNFGNSLQAIRIEAEDYQDYYDLTSSNTGGEYRQDDVDLGTSQDVGRGFAVGWIDAGEWLTYNFDIPEDGTYQVVARIASDFDIDHSLDVSIDGQKTTVNFEDTGGWESWSDIIAGNFELTAGNHELRLDMNSSGFNINYIDLITPEDIRIEAEDYQYDNYDDLEDTTYDNKGGAYRDDRVDVEPTRDIGGGFNIGWIESGEWLTYKVDIPYDGNYQVVARVASQIDQTHRLDVSIDGQATVLNFDGTGGWQSWTDATGDRLYLTAGTYELRLDMGSSGFNINYIDLISDRNSVEALVTTDESLVLNENDFI